MIPAPYRVCRDMDDDYAPVDYSYAASSAEAARLRQQQNIKRPGAAGVAARHRVEPAGKADAYGIRAREVPKDNSVRDTVMRKLPSLSDSSPRVESVAYPDDFGIPENPFVPPPERKGRAGVGTRVVESGTREESGRAAPRRARAVMPDEAERAPARESVAPDGSRFDPPISPDMPEWLRVARQNPLTQEDRLARAPRVKPAPSVAGAEPQQTDALGRPLRTRAAQPPRRTDPLPRNAREYEEAGYPEPLLREQSELEAEVAEQSRRRRHGAQYAVNPYRQEDYERRASQAGISYPPERRAPDARADNGYVSDSRPPRDDTRGAAYESAAGDIAYARRPARAPAYEAAATQGSPYRVVTDERRARGEEEDAPVEEERSRVPWLPIAVFAAAFISVGLWLFQISFDRQTQQIVEAREQAAQTMIEKHPYRYRELIELYAREYNLNPAFVAAIVLNESSFDPSAVSSVGARGLMQLMDDTAGWIYDKMGGGEGYNFDTMFTPDTNLRYGCWYLSFLSERFRGDPVLVSAAFHAGQNTVQNWLNDSRYSQDSLTIRLEDMMDGPTKQYATRVTRAYAAYLGIYYTEDA